MLPDTRDPRPASAISDQTVRDRERGQVLVLWVIWAALISGVVILQLMLGKGIPSGKNPPGAGIDLFAVVALVQVLAATGVRWLLLPRSKVPGQKLVVMIIGLALSEAAAFLEIFLIPTDHPETRLLVFVLAMAGMLQFVPIYARSGASENRLPGARDKRP